MNASPAKKTILSAVQPTGVLTLGTYLGALKNWVQLQDEYDCYFMAVDLHAITVRQAPEELLNTTYQALALYLASGIRPESCHLFVQSHVSQHAELGWILNCFSYMGELNRMTQYKDKSKKSGKNIGAGLFTYPTLMAADILLYDTDLVPIGADQKQHLELTRDLAMRVNHLYGEDTFRVPDGYFPKVGAKIMSLQDPHSKMSKSDPNTHATVFLMDTDKQIEKKLKKAVTDSGSEITFSDEKPGVKNLLSIYSAISKKPIEEVVEHFQGKQYGHLKVETAEVVIEGIRPIRDRALQLLEDRTYLDQILQKGAEKAREKATQTLRRVHDRLGFIPKRG